MRNSLHVKYESLKVTDFKRRVVENVEVLGAKRILLAQHGRKSGGNLPNVRRKDANSRRALQIGFEIHQDVSVVPEGVCGIQLARPHGKLVCINTVGRMPLASTVCDHAPRVLVGLFPLEWLACGCGRGEVLHVTCKLSHEI